MSTSKRHPTHRRSAVALAVIAAFAAAPAAAEQMLGINLFRGLNDMSRWVDNYVEIGAGYSTEDSYKFGEYNGLRKDGLFGIGGFNWRSVNPTDDARYWHAYGSNLGLGMRKLSFDGGRQGGWRFNLGLDQLTRYETESAQFLHRGLGSSSVTLPFGFPGIANSDGASGAAALPYLTSFGIKQGRDVFHAGLRGLFSSSWDFKVNYREDRRDGTRITGAIVAPSAGGARRSLLVPYPLDDRTQQIDAVASYAGKQAQFQLGYTYSRYDNDLNAFSWQNPYTAGAGATIGLGGTARMSLMPSNEFHQVNATGTYRFTPRTRVRAQVAYGAATQNEPFQPYTSNPAFTPKDTTAGLPRASLDGKVISKLVDLVLTSRATDKLNVKLGYTHRASDNKTPQGTYQYVINDVSNNAASAERTNVPVSSKENRLVADADYEILPRTHLRGVYEHRRISYVNADRDRLNDNKLSIDLRRAMTDSVTGNIGYAHTRRRGTDYDKNQFFAKSYSAAFRATAPGGFDNHPQMRQFLYNDYDEDRVRLSGNWTVSETVSLQAGADGFVQRYKAPNCTDAKDPNVVAALAGTALPDDCLGRKRSTGNALHVDGQWQPDENLTWFGFYSRTSFGADGRGRNWTTLANSVTNASYDYQTEYVDNTLGLGVKWQPKTAWDVGAQYAYNRGLGTTAVLNGGQSVPDNVSNLQTLQLYSKWRYSKRYTVRFNYLYERLTSRDWSYTDASPTSTSTVLLTGQTSPRHDNHVLGVSLAIHDF